MRRSAQIRKPNVRYKEYVQTIIDSDSTEGNTKNSVEEEVIATHMTEYVLMQLSLKKGLDVFRRKW